MNKRLIISVLIIAVLVAAGAVIDRSRRREVVAAPVASTAIGDDAEPVEMLFVGDIMLDRTVRTTVASRGFNYPFQNVSSLFAGTDLAVGNLEGTITANPSVSQKDFDILKFTFDPGSPAGLKSLGFSGLSLANNHALDFGNDGFLETEADLSQAGLFSFGSPTNAINLSENELVKGSRVCFVGYHALFREDPTPVAQEIKSLRSQCNYIVVYAHWGEEYSDTVTPAQKRESESFVDAGADLVVGTHPHVVEPVEIYKGKPIFYSLGNFIFDQDFSEATKLGLAVRETLTATSTTFRLTPIEIDRNRLSFAATSTFMSRMNILTSGLPADLKSAALSTGILTLPR